MQTYMQASVLHIYTGEMRRLFNTVHNNKANLNNFRRISNNTIDSYYNQGRKQQPQETKQHKHQQQQQQ